MNETKKLQDTAVTAVIALLAETFPKCFSLMGHAAPREQLARVYEKTLRNRAVEIPTKRAILGA